MDARYGVNRSITHTLTKFTHTLKNNDLRIITFCPDVRDHVTPIYAAQNILKIKKPI